MEGPLRSITAFPLAPLSPSTPFCPPQKAPISVPPGFSLFSLFCTGAFSSTQTNGSTLFGKRGSSDAQYVYDLHAVIVHLGGAGGGHYVAYRSASSSLFSFPLSASLILGNTMNTSFSAEEERTIDERRGSTSRTRLGTSSRSARSSASRLSCSITHAELMRCRIKSKKS